MKVKTRLLQTCLSLLSLVSLAFLSPAFAATPVAVWDNNFDDPTNGGWTLDLNGNTANQVTDGDTTVTNSLTIVEGVGGIKFTQAAKTFCAVSVIIRCSGLDVNSTANQALFTTCLSESSVADRSTTGVYLKGSDHKPWGIWQGASWGSAGSAVSTSPTTMGFRSNSGNGTFLVVGDDSGFSKPYDASGLRRTSMQYTGISIGGMWSTSDTTFTSAPGLTITAVAIFTEELTQSDVEAYKFPSEITEFTATEEISGEKNWSDINFAEGITWKNAAGSTATLTLAGDTVLTLPDDFQAATVTVKGAYKLTLKGGKSYFDLVGSELTAVERDVFYSTSIAQTIAANHTYIVGGNATLSGNNTVAAGGTLKVTNGTATVAFADRGVSGTVEIAKGATLTATSKDALNYDSSTFKVNVYGTLNFSSTRWTFKGGELHLYDNAKVTGTGESGYGAVDVWNTVYAHKNTTTDEDSEAAAQTMTISAPVRYTGNDGAQPTFNVEENVTLVFSTAGLANNCTKLVKTGAGTLKLSANQPLTGVSEVQEGTLELACDSALSGTTTVSEGATLKVSDGTYDLTSHTNNGTVEVAGGTVTVSSSIGGTVNWTDGTLKVKVTADQATSGLTLENVTITKTDDANVIFVLPSGEEVTGRGKTLTAIKTWVGSASGDWATASNWSGGAVPTAEDMVIITNETVEITVAEGDVMPKTLEIAKGATLKGTLGSSSAALALLHVDANATLTLDGVTATTASIDSGATLTINGTATVNALTGSGTLVLEEGTTLSMSDNYVTLFTNWSGLVKGKGALTATYVPGSSDVKSMLQNSTRWQATIAFVGLTNQTNFNLNDYGNASSTVRMTGCSLYFIQSNGASNYPNRTFTPTLELCDGDYGYGIKVNNGWSNDIIEFTKLTGDGTFLMAKPNGAPTRRFFFPTACLADFKGTIKMETSGNISTLYLGRGRADYSSDSAHNGDIVIAGEIASGFKVVNEVGNIVFQDGATLTASDTETAKIKGVSCEMDSGATVTLKTSLTTLTDVTSLPFVAWTTKPSDLTFTIDNDTLPAKRWRLSQKSTGLYVVRKYGTMILVK